MIEAVLCTIGIASLSVVGLWGASKPEQILAFIRTTPILRSKWFSGDCVCPASFWGSVVFWLVLATKWELFLFSRFAAAKFWEMSTDITIDITSVVIILFCQLFAVLGTAGVLLIVGQWLEYKDAEKLYKELKKLQETDIPTKAPIYQGITTRKNNEQRNDFSSD